jgi:RNA polymerase sigma factor (sigma-70 family)
MHPLAQPENEFLPTRRSLLTRLKDWDDQEGWREFFDTYWRLIYSVASKAGLTDAEAQDLVQETVVAVAKKMRRFHYDPALGSFKAWLLIVVRSRIADHLRRKNCRIQMVSPAAVNPNWTALENLPGMAANSFETLWEKEWQEQVFEAALERVKRQVSPKQYQLFDLAVVQQVPVRKITGTLGVSLGQVYLAKHRVGRLIRQEVQRLESKML